MGYGKVQYFYSAQVRPSPGKEPGHFYACCGIFTYGGEAVIQEVFRKVREHYPSMTDDKIQIIALNRI